MISTSSCLVQSVQPVHASCIFNSGRRFVRLPVDFVYRWQKVLAILCHRWQKANTKLRLLSNVAQKKISFVVGFKLGFIVKLLFLVGNCSNFSAAQNRFCSRCEINSV
jgi:hypothetical protein